jgi:hypothetical protein
VLYVNPTGDVLLEETRTAHTRTPGAAYAEMPGDAGAVMQYPKEFAATVSTFLARSRSQAADDR